MMRQKNILEYLEATVARYPDKTAFSNGKEDLSFAELYAKARAIGSYLSDNRYSREPIAIIMDKHPNVLSAFLGVNYAGCFYA